MSAKMELLYCDKVGCAKSFKTRVGKSKHMKKCNLQQRQKEKQYSKEAAGVTCDKCNKRFTKLSNFYRYNKEVHLQKKKVVEKKTCICIVCSKFFTKNHIL